MAQPRLDSVILQVSHKVGELITDPTDDTGTFTMLDKVSAINEARKKVYSENLVAVNNEMFIKMFPEWREFVTDMSLEVKPDKVRTVLSMVKDGVIINPLNPELYIDAKYNSYSKWKGSDSEMWFMEYKKSIEVINQPAIITADAFIYTQPINLVRDTGEDDMQDPEIWIPDIVERAIIFLETDTQRA